MLWSVSAITFLVWRSYIFGFDLATIVTNSLQNLLHFCKETIVVDWLRQLDDTKVTWTNILILFAGSALEVAIDGSEMRIVRASFAGS
jgi:hypothetical protein